MKVIEAMKMVKANREKIADLQAKIAANCAGLSHETPVYGADTARVVNGWLQACQDLSQECAKLLVRISKTNIQTNVSITIAGQVVTKSIAEWVWRRREFAVLDLKSVSVLGDRGLREGAVNVGTAQPLEVKIVRYFDPMQRDKLADMYRSEPHLIDAALEVVNAVTELVE